MSNLRNAPLFLTPQTVRGVLGIGHPKRTAELPIEGRVNGSDKLAQPSKVVGGGKTMSSIGFISVGRDGALSPMMTASEFIKDATPRTGFWRVRAKQTDKQTHEIAAVVPPSQQGRDGDLSSPDPIVVPAKNSEVSSAQEPDETFTPRAKARRVAASVPAPSKTAGTGAIFIGMDLASKPDVHVETEIETATGKLVSVVKKPAPKPPAPIGTNWIANRFEQLASAIAFLKTHNVDVQVVNKDADIKKYRVSSQGFQAFYHEEVLEIAMDMGWAG